MIKTGEGDDPIGVLTVLSTHGSGAAAKALQEFRAFLLRSIKDAEDQEKLRAVSSGGFLRLRTAHLSLFRMTPLWLTRSRGECSVTGLSAVAAVSMRLQGILRLLHCKKASNDRSIR